MKRIVFGIAILIILANIILFMSPGLFESGNDAFFSYFHLHNVNLNISYSICFIIVFSYAVIEPYYNMALSHYDRLCIVRLGYPAFYRKCMKEIVLKSILFRILLESLLFLCMVLFWGSIQLEYDVMMVQHTLSFHPDLVMNLFMYIIFSSIGTAILGVFLFSMIDFIKNRYIFRFFMPVALLITTVGSAIILPPIYKIFITFINNDRLVRTLVSFFVPLNLFEPGSLWSSFGILSLITSGIFFLTLSIVALKISIKRRYQYG